MKKHYVLSIIFILIGMMISGSVQAQWTLQTNPLGSGDAAKLGKIQFVSATEGWIASGSNGSLLHTTTGGSTWNIVTPFPNDAVGNMSDPAQSMSWVNPTHGWALKSFISGNDFNTDANGAVLYGTADGGSNWTRKTFPQSVSPIVYYKTDLTGNWQFHALTAKNPSSPSSISGWMYGIASIDANGNCVIPITRSDGTTKSPAITMDITSRGRIVLNGSEMGFMSDDKNTIYMTGKEDNDGYSIYIMQKQIPSTTYTPADLQGDWQMHGLSSGNTANEHSGWIHAAWTADVNGNFTGTFYGHDNTPMTLNTSIAISSTGEISGMGSVGSFTHGFMSADKKIFYLVMTGSETSDYNLAVFQKHQPSATYNLSDLQGVWREHTLITMNANNSYENNVKTTGFITGSMTLNASGSGTVNNSAANDNITFSMDANGLISTPPILNGSTNIHGYLSDDKKTMIITMTDVYGGYEIAMMQKDLSVSGDIGLQVQFATETTGWVSIYNMIYGNFQIYKTTDSGSTWNPMTISAGGFYYYVDAGNGWMIGSTGNIGEGSLNNIFHTTNGGLTWTLQASNIGNANALYFSDLLHGWVVGRDGLVLKTTDGGTNWTPLTNTGQTAGSNSKIVYFLDANNGWIGSGRDNTEGVGSRFILATKDGGSTWTTQPTPVTNDIFSLSFQDANTGWLTSDHGQIAKYTSPRMINIAAGGLSTALTSTEKNTLTSIGISGTIDARDFKTMRDNMPLLTDIDLSGTTVLAYSGTEGTYGTAVTDYPGNTTPRNAFYSKTNLNSVILPSTLAAIGKSSFYKCSGLSSINIPSTVALIDTWSFGNCTNLKSLSIPTSVITIGESAFIRSGLTNIVLPQGLKVIGNYAFQNCATLNSVAISSSVSKIGYCAFTFNNALQAFQVATDNTTFSELNGVLYDKPGKKLICYPGGKGTSYQVPEGVTGIDTAAFEGSNAIQNVSLPSSLTTLAVEAFYWCPNLMTIDIPAAVNVIGAYSFYKCNSLSSVTVHSTTPVNLSTSDSVFKYVSFNTCKLIVPSGSKALYQAANQWKDFINIMEQGSSTTYNVTVPVGTKACYIAGDMNNWGFTSMTKVDDTHFTINLMSSASNGYKYCSGPGWNFQEVDAFGNYTISNRTYSTNDVVARWASVYDPSSTNITYSVTVPSGTKACYIAGVMNSWSFTPMNKVDNTHYTITILSSTNYAYKFCSGPSWDFVEVNADGSYDENRSYQENDNVLRWLSVFDLASLTAADYYLPLTVGNYTQLHTANVPMGSNWGTRNVFYSYIRSENVNGVPYIVEQGKDILDNDQNNVNVFRVFWLRKDNSGNIVAGAYSQTNNDNLNSAVILPTPAMIFPNQFLTVGYSQTYATGNYTTQTDSVISVTAQVGSFGNCIQVRNIVKTNGVVTMIEDSYYAYHVGLVKLDRLFPVNEAHIEMMVNYVSNQVTGINELVGNDNLIMYPNPLTEGFYIHVGEKSATVTIYNLSGVKLLSRQISGRNYIDIATLQQGVYLVKIASGEGTFEKKLVKK